MKLGRIAYTELVFWSLVVWLVGVFAAIGVLLWRTR